MPRLSAADQVCEAASRVEKASDYDMYGATADGLFEALDQITIDHILSDQPPAPTTGVTTMSTYDLMVKHGRNINATTAMTNFTITREENEIPPIHFIQNHRMNVLNDLSHLNAGSLKRWLT